MSRIMVDLETMGTKSTSAIVAIGAVKFDIDGIHDRFHQTIDLDSCLRHGLTVDGGAIYFWLSQSYEARASIMGGQKEQLINSLTQFAQWGMDVHEIWGNGANFDEPILNNAFAKCNFIPPWKFWMSRCHRTMKQTFPNVAAPPFVGTQHNALHDAENQALHLIEILKSIGEK